MLLADGGSVRRANPPAPPPPPPAPTPQQGQGFEAAVKKAQSDRAAADGKPNGQRGNEAAHQAKQGDSLWSIAQEYRAPFSQVLAANRQFHDRNHIEAGQVVFVPNPDPRVINTRNAVANAHQADNAVADLKKMAHDPNSTPSERKLAQNELPNAEAEASRRWTDIQNSVAGEIRNAGRSATFPDDATRSTVAELRGRVPNDTRYQAAVDRAVAKVDQEWRDGGITRGEIDGLVRDARAADRSVASLEQLANAPGATPGERKLANIELPEARSAASAAWAKVRGEFENDLRTQGTGQPYPEELVRSHVDDIKKQYADDPKVQDAVDAAYRTVTDEWRAQGWTRDTLGKVVDGYDTVKKDEQAVAAAQASGSADLPALQSQLERDRTALRQEIERQLDDVAGKVTPDQREMAIGARAALIEKNGPSDQAFKDIVDQAAYNKLVQPGVDAVRNAYQSGGAKAAAETLRQQTENASPETAARIVAGSMSTIENIAVDIKHSLTDGGSIKYQDVAGVYANVATATDYAARASNGAQVTADVARVMVREMPTQKFHPQSGPTYPVGAYQEAVMLSVSTGTGATLALEMTAQLREAGRTDVASSMLSATTVGVEVFGGKIEKGVTDFRDATAEISQLRADWAGIMTRDQLDQATVKYVAQHTDILPNFDRTYNALDGLGYGAVRTGLALDKALPRLQGLDDANHLADVRGDFAGAKETQLAVGVSQKANDEVLRVVLSQAAETPAGANPTSSISSSRGFVKELGNALMTSQPSSAAAIADLTGGAGPAVIPTPIKDAFGTGRDVKIDPKKTSLFGGSMNGLGAAFAGYQSVLAWQKVANDPGRLLDMTKAVYYTIGTGKESAELLAFGAQRGWLGLDKVIPESLSTSILAKANRTGLALEPGWVKFSSYFKIGAGVIDLAFAADSAAKGDWIAAGLYTTSASGGFLMAAGSVAASGGWLATWGGPVGAGIVLASALGLYWHNDAKAKARMEGPSREFLEAAGYKPEVAKALADYSDQDGQSAGPAIAATAQQFGVTPEQLMERLNRMDPDKVHDLVEQAWTVDADDKGRFPLTAPNDRNVWAPPGKDPQFGGSYLYDPQDKEFRGEYMPGGGGFPARIEDPNPRSMTALRDYARVLFGEPVLG